ncbi:MAG: dihydroorotase [Chitinophagia bacterium]|nr:dihydroorotase [Chitinophagia bacterium]
MQQILIKNTTIVNEGTQTQADVWLKDGLIYQIAPVIDPKANCREIDGEGLYLLPGVIDDQVHFREPGLTHKATIATESRAAVAGGTTSFMEMPNTVPPAVTISALEEKYAIAAQYSPANYSFFMGVSNTNADEALRVNDFKKSICGLKIFMGSSTGDMLVDNYLTLDKIFGNSEVLIATHCEEERVINQNKLQYPDANHAGFHPLIRNEEACYESSFTAIQLAKKHNSRLHILHISTKEELRLFTNLMPLADKRITAEVCVHHLHFTANDYPQYGNLIKCNPAIKNDTHKPALWEALLDNRLDIIATDHAPHTLAEKEMPYSQAPSGVPLVQHSLMLMLQYVQEGKLTIEKMVEKMCHAPAMCFDISKRGYIREGYYADLVLVNPKQPYTVSKSNILYKCGWSPFEGHTFPASIDYTIINGNIVYEKGTILDLYKGKRLEFDRA